MLDLDVKKQTRGQQSKIAITKLWCIANVLFWSSTPIGHCRALTHWGETNLPPFSRRYFQMHFLEWKYVNFAWDLLTLVPEVRINNISALVQIMAWCQPGDKPLPEPMMLVFWRIYASLGLNELTCFPAILNIMFGCWNSYNHQFKYLMHCQLLDIWLIDDGCFIVHWRHYQTDS